MRRKAWLTALASILTITACQSGGVVSVRTANRRIPANRPPVILSLTAEPASAVAGGASVLLRVRAEDPDQDALRIVWQAAAGTLTATEGAEVHWAPPDSPGDVALTVQVNDGRHPDVTQALTVSVTPAGTIEVPAPVPSASPSESPSAPAPTPVPVTGGGGGGPGVAPPLIGPTPAPEPTDFPIPAATPTPAPTPAVVAAGALATIGPTGAVDMLNPPRGFADGPVADARFLYPHGIVVDSAGYVYVADTENHRVRRITPWGTVDTIAGTGTAGYDPGEINSRWSMLNRPEGLALDSSGNLYVADMGNHVIRKIMPGGRILTVAGIGFPGYSPDGTPGRSARLNNPIAVAVDASGNLYIGDLGNRVVRKVWKATTAIQTIAGSGVASAPVTSTTPPDVGDGGPATAATLGDFGPTGLALDAFGNLFIADTYNHRIRMVRPQGTISTVVGKGVPPLTDPTNPLTFSAALLGDEGPANAACLYYPRSVVITPGNQMLIADFGSNQVRHVVGGIISRQAGDPNGISGSSGDGGPARDARLSGPAGLALAPNAIYIAEWGTHRIRILQR